jgi:hypothetical protein
VSNEPKTNATIEVIIPGTKACVGNIGKNMIVTNAPRIMLAVAPTEVARAQILTHNRTGKRITIMKKALRII